MLNKNIEKWMLDHQEEYLKDLADLISYPSVAQEQDNPDMPYGTACADVLHYMLDLGKKYGFQTENIENRVCRIIYSPETDRDIGIWGHLDVVAAGTGWEQADPFQLRQEGDWLFGRGVRDNKGPVMSALYAMRYLKEAGIPCNRGLSLYLGCCEEVGLKDVEWYVSSGQRCASWNLVVDSAWPLTQGEKGIVSCDLYSDAPLPENVLDLWSGIADNSVPSEAYVLLAEGTSPVIQGQALTIEDQDGCTKITAKGRAGHSAFPERGINALGLLSEALRQEEPFWEDLYAFSGSYTGTAAGIAVSDPAMGDLTCAATTLRLTEDRTLKLHLNIRYPAATTAAEIRAGLTDWCQRHGWHLEVAHEMDGYFLPVDHPMVATLLSAYNDIMEVQARPFVLSGGTYAGRLPNAVGFGMGGQLAAGWEKVLKPGHGFGHAADECNNLSLLLQGASIYVEALTRLAALD